MVSVCEHCKLESTGARDSQVRHLQGTFSIADWCGRAQHIVGSATSGQECPGCIKK